MKPKRKLKESRSHILLAGLFCLAIFIPTSWSADPSPAPSQIQKLEEHLDQLVSDPDLEVIFFRTVLPQLHPPKEFHPQVKEFLRKNGFELNEKDGSLKETQSGVAIDMALLAKANLGYTPNGFFLFLDTIITTKAGSSANLVSPRDLPAILKGLIPFALSISTSSRNVGITLQKWGLPISFNGLHLVNPDGTATYYGHMVYQGFSKNPQAIKGLSGERLVESLRLMESAFQQAFAYNAPDVAKVDLDRAWDLLIKGNLSLGETPIPLRSGTIEIGKWIGDKAEKMIALATQEKGKGAQADKNLMQEYSKTVAKLKSLYLYKYEADKNLNTAYVKLPEMPLPASNTKPGQEDTPIAIEESPLPPRLITIPAKELVNAVPLQHKFLPGLISFLENLMGKPLALEEAEALIKSFPMGETIWRTGAWELWREGLTGKNIKIAVIDSGVSPHVDLLDAVGNRTYNFTRQRGRSIGGVHGTHVAGIIHALAPDAQISSYKIGDGEFLNDNGRVVLDHEEFWNRVLVAIDQAVTDGNTIINMSLGKPFGPPTSILTEKIDSYAKKGIIFIVSAGNSGPYAKVGAPSRARGALTAGALDVNNKMTFFSSWGANFDPPKTEWVVKQVLLVPGHDIPSTVPSGKSLSSDYHRFSGTSMAAPHGGGAAGLLMEGIKKLNANLNPVQLVQNITDSFFKAGKVVPRDRLPSDVPPDQEFVIMDPVASYNYLKRTVPPAVAQNPTQPALPTPKNVPPALPTPSQSKT